MPSININPALRQCTLYLSILVLLAARHISCSVVKLPSSTLLGYTSNQWQSLLDQLAEAEAAHPLGNTEDHKHDTPLANLYIRLHRQLFASRHLPVSDWGRAYPGQTITGAHHHDQVHLELMPEFTRASINKFWRLHKGDIRLGSRCLEFAPIFYSRLTEHCKERWTLEYEKDPQKWSTDSDNLVVYADLSRPASVNRLPKGMFDVVIATQAMQYPTDTILMAKAFHNMLQQGGLLMLTAPFVERVDSAYGDRYRFSQLGVETSLSKVGFESRYTYVGGNTMTTTAFLMGFSATDISAREREHSLLFNTTNNSQHEYEHAVYYGVYGTWYRQHPKDVRRHAQR